MAVVQTEFSASYILWDSVVFCVEWNGEVITNIVPVSFMGDGTVSPESDLFDD